MFIEPTDQLLRYRFDGELNYAVLQKLICLKISSGLLRLFSLWIIRSWRSFKTRFCKKCSQVVESQFHVVSCTQLSETLNSDHSLPHYLPLDPPRPRSASLVVEERIRSIVLKQQPSESAISQLEVLPCVTIPCVALWCHSFKFARHLRARTRLLKNLSYKDSIWCGFYFWNYQ